VILKTQQDNGSDHRAGINDHPFQKHTQVRLMVIVRRDLLPAAGAVTQLRASRQQFKSDAAKLQIL